MSLWNNSVLNDDDLMAILFVLKFKVGLEYIGTVQTGGIIVVFIFVFWSEEMYINKYQLISYPKGRRSQFFEGA